VTAACTSCGQPLKPGAAFCAQCGAQQVVAPPRGGLRLAIGMYLALLAAQLVALIYVRITDQQLTAIWIASIGITGVTLVCAVTHLDLFADAYRRTGWSWGPYALVIVAAPVIVALVWGYVSGLERLFGPQLDELAPLRGHPTALIVLMIGIPPVIEELAFRGIMFGALLRAQFSPRETVLLTAFAFALLHLSIPSLVTHVPLGLYFGWLRQRSGSLWPGMLAHACHNAGVLAINALGWG
jgi:membrane protease YdiL (CAAX protease family)